MTSTEVVLPGQGNPKDNRNITFENVQILFRNFEGKEGLYNREGDRNFAMIIEDPALAAQMKADGWNVKQLRPRDEGDEPKSYIQVSVSYRLRPPKMVLITGGFQTALPEDMLSIFDWIDIENVDLTLNPSHWSVSGNSGIKAYLAGIWITQRRDELEIKYENVPKLESSRSIIEDSIGTPLELEAGQTPEDPNIIDAEIVYEPDED